MTLLSKIVSLSLFASFGIFVPAIAQQAITFKVMVSIAPTSEPGEINYSPKVLLKQEDFKSNRYTGAYYDVARVWSGMTLDYRGQGYGGAFELYIKLSAAMNPQRSWMKPEGRTPAILRHEQMHFHITGLAVCSLKKALEDAPLDKASFKQQIAEIDKAHYDALRAEQDRYDSETVHGTNLEQQARWEREIADRLAEQDCFPLK